jgi:hypothetical protein
MAEEDLKVRVRLVDAARAQRDAEQTGKKIRGIGTSAEVAGEKSKVASKKFGLMGHATSGLKSALAFTGVGALAFGIKDAVHAGITWQEQQAQLRLALGKTADGMQKLKEINEAVDRSATHGGFAPSEEIQGIQKFTTLTGSATKALELNKAAVDLARGGHMTYSAAQTALSQATVGNVRRLQKLVGVITPVTTNMDLLRLTTKNASPEMVAHAKALDKQATATAAVQRVTEKFGGATDAYGKTAAGAMSNAENAFDLAKEKLGAALLPTVTKGAQALTGFVMQMQDGTGAGGEFADEMESIGKAVLPPLKSMVQIGGAVLKFVGHHPGLAKVAGDLVAVGLAVKAIRFVGAISGVSSLIRGLAGVATKATAATTAVEGVNAAERTSLGPAAAARGGRTWGTAFGKAGALAIGAAVVIEAPSIYAQLADSLLGKGNAFSDEARHQGYRDLGLLLTPESTSAHDTVTGRTPQQQANRMRDPNYRAWLRRRKHHSMGGLIPGAGRAGAGDTELGR